MEAMHMKAIAHNKSDHIIMSKEVTDKYIDNIFVN